MSSGSFPIPVKNVVRITKDDVIPLVRAQVERMGPDFVYNPSGDLACYYRPMREDETELGDPRLETGCLVGEILKDAGIAPEILDLSMSIYTLVSKHPEHFDIEHDALNVLAVVQASQDGGSTWGEALQRGEDEILNLNFEEVYQ